MTPPTQGHVLKTPLALDREVLGLEGFNMLHEQAFPLG